MEVEDYITTHKYISVWFQIILMLQDITGMVKHVLFWSSIKSFCFIWSKDGPNLTPLEDDFNMAAENDIQIYYQLKYS